METEAKEVRKPQILIVDDEVAMVRSLELLLRPIGTITKAYSVPEAEEVLGKAVPVDCIVTDVSMPEASGIDLLNYVRKKSPEIPVVIMTAYSSVPQAVEAMQKGAFKYLVKPFENAEMVAVVEKAIAKKGIQYGGSKKLPRGWVCNSKAMKDFVLKAEKLKESPVLLILGETGVGKSRAAAWLHEQSSRAKKDFFAIDGRAHEEDSPLLTSPMAKVGTLFVAEIFSLSRRLQDRVMDLVTEGATSVLASSSSDADLQALPHFRKDLFERLKGLTLSVPPLRDRAEDFEALCSDILVDLAKRLKIKPLILDPRALEKLKSHFYTGNSEELERILERAALESNTLTIFEEAIRFSEANLKDLLPFSVPVEGGWKRLEVLHQSLESELILRALEKYPECSNSEIANLVGTTRRILELRMKEYQIREGS